MGIDCGPFKPIADNADHVRNSAVDPQFNCLAIKTRPQDSVFVGQSDDFMAHGSANDLYDTHWLGAFQWQTAGGPAIHGMRVHEAAKHAEADLDHLIVTEPWDVSGGSNEAGREPELNLTRQTLDSNV